MPSKRTVQQTGLSVRASNFLNEVGQTLKSTLVKDVERDELTQTLRELVDDLPNSSLRRELQNNFSVFEDALWTRHQSETSRIGLKTHLITDQDVREQMSRIGSDKSLIRQLALVPVSESSIKEPLLFACKDRNDAAAYASTLLKPLTFDSCSHLVQRMKAFYRYLASSDDSNSRSFNDSSCNIDQFISICRLDLLECLSAGRCSASSLAQYNLMLARLLSYLRPNSGSFDLVSNMLSSSLRSSTSILLPLLVFVERIWSHKCWSTHSATLDASILSDVTDAKTSCLSRVITMVVCECDRRNLSDAEVLSVAILIRSLPADSASRVCKDVGSRWLSGMLSPTLQHSLDGVDTLQQLLSDDVQLRDLVDCREQMLTCAEPEAEDDDDDDENVGDKNESDALGFFMDAAPDLHNLSEEQLRAMDLLVDSDDNEDDDDGAVSKAVIDQLDSEADDKSDDDTFGAELAAATVADLDSVDAASEEEHSDNDDDVERDEEEEVPKRRSATSRSSKVKRQRRL